jgi:hypothetical protein
MKEERKKRQKEGRKKRKKEGRKKRKKEEGRKERGRKEGRKEEGRKEGRKKEGEKGGITDFRKTVLQLLLLVHNFLVQAFEQHLTSKEMAVGKKPTGKKRAE